MLSPTRSTSIDKATNQKGDMQRTDPANNEQRETQIKISDYEYFICRMVALLHDLVSEIHGVSTLRGAWARPINQVTGRASAPVDLHRDENGSEALPAPALSSSSSRLPRRTRERLLGREALSTERARRDPVPGSGQVNAWRCPFHGNPGRARRGGGDRCPT